MQDHINKPHSFYDEEEEEKKENSISELNKKSTKANLSNENVEDKKKVQQRNPNTFQSKTEINSSKHQKNKSIFSEKKPNINTVKNENNKNKIFNIFKNLGEKREKAIIGKKRGRSCSNKSPNNEFNNQINKQVIEMPKTEINNVKNDEAVDEEFFFNSNYKKDLKGDESLSEPNSTHYQNQRIKDNTSASTNFITNKK